MGGKASVWAFLLACAVASPASAVVTGEPDQGGSPVAALYRAGGDSPYCSATFVTQNVLVTAAHCLPPFQPFLDMFVRDSVRGHNHDVLSYRAHPLWAGPDDVAHDIGVVYVVRSPFDNDAIQPVARLPHRPLERRAFSGLVQGFGLTRTAAADEFQAYEGCAYVAEVTRATLELGGDYVTCNGDSGGPLFIDLDGAQVLAGVHSRSDCESWAEETRVDRYVRGFILPFIRERNPEFGCEDPAARCDLDRAVFCADQEADESCSAELCAADGECQSACVRDPDCSVEAECPAPTASGCSAAGGMTVPWWLGLLLPLLRRRRRVGRLRCQDGMMTSW